MVQTPPAAAPPPPSKDSTTTLTPTQKKIESITIRSYSDVIFFYPTFFVSLVFIFLSLFMVQGNLPVVLSWIWLIIFIYNIFIVAFDFPSGKLFALVAVIIAVVMLLVVLAVLFPQLSILSYVFVFLQLEIRLTWQFYLVMTITFGIVFLILILSSYISYVEIKSNQVYIKKGILGEKINQPTRGMQVYKEIDDIFEYAVLKSGDITLMFPPGSRFVTLSLPNVININQKVTDINYIISKTEVDIH
ncbi:MAG: hypothetical protein EAX96_07675 [Candidatus Lokiarchaeota archaeon]|nr:hypothetical protein [Candidatus Lokiarchaeota archaeon]